MSKKPPLNLVTPIPHQGIQPPRPLGEHGAILWRTVMDEYDFQDGAGREMLALACAALDRAESMRTQIDADGECIRTKTGLKDHPLLRHEAVARAFVVKTLKALNLDVEPIRPVGRPAGPANKGWSA
jgi:hypothetical protein